MPMTKKDYVMISEQIKQALADSTRSDDAFSQRVAIRAVARGLADKFGNANPAFDSTRFLVACEPGDTEYRLPATPRQMGELFIPEDKMFT